MIFNGILFPLLIICCGNEESLLLTGVIAQQRQPKSTLSAKDYLLKVIMPIGIYFSLSLLFVNTMATVHCF